MNYRLSYPTQPVPSPLPPPPTQVKPEDVVSVSVMPCVRKQGEADRDWFASEAAGGGGAVRDVDHVITTAELGKIFTERGINLKELPETEYDNPLGTGSGGGVLFGTTGGVMEAALRTVYELVSGAPMERINFEPARGLEGIKEATVRGMNARLGAHRREWRGGRRRLRVA